MRCNAQFIQMRFCNESTYSSQALSWYTMSFVVVNSGKNVLSLREKWIRMMKNCKVWTFIIWVCYSTNIVWIIKQTQSVYHAWGKRETPKFVGKPLGQFNLRSLCITGRIILTLFIKKEIWGLRIRVFRWKKKIWSFGVPQKKGNLLIDWNLLAAQ